jgi:hypothetical protein
LSVFPGVLPLKRETIEQLINLKMIKKTYRQLYSSLLLYYYSPDAKSFHQAVTIHWSFQR